GPAGRGAWPGHVRGASKGRRTGEGPAPALRIHSLRRGASLVPVERGFRGSCSGCGGARRLLGAPLAVLPATEHVYRRDPFPRLLRPSQRLLLRQLAFRVHVPVRLLPAVLRRALSEGAAAVAGAGLRPGDDDLHAAGRARSRVSPDSGPALV